MKHVLPSCWMIILLQLLLDSDKFVVEVATMSRVPSLLPDPACCNLAVTPPMVIWCWLVGWWLWSLKLLILPVFPKILQLGLAGAKASTRIVQVPLDM